MIASFDITNLDGPAGQVYFCTILLLFVGACVALPIHVIRQRKEQEGLTKVPWWGIIVFLFPYIAPLIPGRDKWTVPKEFAYPLIGIGLLLAGFIALAALIGLVQGIIRLLA